MLVWLVDLLIEAFIALTIIEQLALTLGSNNRDWWIIIWFNRNGDYNIGMVKVKIGIVAIRF